MYADDMIVLRLDAGGRALPCRLRVCIIGSGAGDPAGGGDGRVPHKRHEAFLCESELPVVLLKNCRNICWWWSCCNWDAGA